MRGLLEGGENCLKYLKGGGAETRGGETNILKKWSKLGQGVGAFKRGGGDWNLLMSCDLLLSLMLGYQATTINESVIYHFLFVTVAAASVNEHMINHIIFGRLL